VGISVLFMQQNGTCDIVPLPGNWRSVPTAAEKRIVLLSSHSIARSLNDPTHMLTGTYSMFFASFGSVFFLGGEEPPIIYV
jgi:hypothetical protein